MRRWTISGAALLLAATTTVASAGRATVRGAELDYETNPHNVAVGGAEPVSVLHTGDPAQSYTFPLKKGERSVSVRIVDEGEGDVAGVVSQWVMDRWYGEPNNGAGTGHAVTYVRFCNKTKGPVRLKPDIEVEIFVQAGTCADGTPSLPSSGTITAEFRR